VVATAAEALRLGAARLRDAGLTRTPRLDAELLLGAALGVDRPALLAAPERVLSTDEFALYRSYLGRREAREPVAYIRGRRAFRTIELEVTPAVLIPRPETELLVEVGLEALAAVPAGRDGRFEPLAVDVGTGSGCVALALAAENPFVRVLASDVDAGALEVARRNAARLGLGGRVRCTVADLLDGLAPGEAPDLVVSNPPYVSREEYERLEANVRDYEPRLALEGGEDGLDVVRRLVAAAARRLRRGGVLALEVGAGQAGEAGALLEGAGFAGVQERPDLAGIPRVVWGRRP
jgi:release factor glutamine methyltransferase